MFWRGVLGYLPANIVQGVVGLLTITVFTRLLSPEQYGLYALGFSVMTLVHTVGFTWLEAAQARFFAAEQVRGGVAPHIATLYRAFAWLAAAFVPLAGLAVWLMPLGAELKIAVGAGLAAILARSLVKLVQERRRAAGDVLAASSLDMGQTAGGFAIGAVLAGIGLGGAAPLLGAGLAALLCLPFSLRGELRLGAGAGLETGRVGRYAAYGFPVAGSLVLALVLSTTDRFLIAAFLDAKSVGAYHAAYSLANRTLDVIFIWLGSAGAPALVMALERGGKPALKAAAEEQASTLLLIALPAAAGLALVARPLAELMVGPGLREAAARVTPLIAVGGLFSGVTTYYFHQAFTLGRRTTLLTAAMVVPAVANVGLNLLLIPRFGVAGAAGSTALSYVLGAAVSALLGRKACAMPLPWDALLRCGLATAVMALAVLAVPAFPGVAGLAAKVSAGVLAYGAAVLLLDAAGARSASSRLLKGFLAGRTA